MTLRNDINNWMVIALGTKTKGPYMVCSDQAENVARDAANKYARDNPGVAVGLYQRTATVEATIETKWS